MAAELKVFSDALCTTELTGSPYALQIGPTTGLNGTDGEIETVSVWVRNTGDVDISNVTLLETADTDARGEYSLDDNTYDQTTLDLGTMEFGALGEGDIVRVYIKVTVEALTAVHVDEPLTFTISGTHL